MASCQPTFLPSPPQSLLPHPARREAQSRQLSPGGPGRRELSQSLVSGKVQFLKRLPDSLNVWGLSWALSLCCFGSLKWQFPLLGFWSTFTPHFPLRPRPAFPAAGSERTGGKCSDITGSPATEGHCPQKDSGPYTPPARHLTAGCTRGREPYLPGIG